MATAKRKNDSCDFLPDGQVKLTFDNTPRVLRRPKVGELKVFNKTLVDIASEMQKNGNVVDNLDVDSVVAAQLDWWRDVIDTLKGDEDLPAPADIDDYPTWMTNTDLMVKIQTHWREVPWASGGN